MAWKAAQAVVSEERPGEGSRRAVGRPMARLGLTLVLMTLLLLGDGRSGGRKKRQGRFRQAQSRVAVLPFIDLSAEADQAYFADGLTEKLIAQLAQIHGLTVIARTSVMPYKGTLKDVPTIGRELRVGTLLQGSVRRADNQVRVLAQLIDVACQSRRLTSICTPPT